LDNNHTGSISIQQIADDPILSNLLVSDPSVLHTNNTEYITNDLVEKFGSTGNVSIQEEIRPELINKYENIIAFNLLKCDRIDLCSILFRSVDMFPQAFAQDVNPTEASVMAAVQKPINQSTLGEPSGPPAWKQLPTWYQVSEDDPMIPPDAEHMFAQRMNATTISINSSHASLVSHPDEIEKLILNATQGTMG